MGELLYLLDFTAGEADPEFGRSNIFHTQGFSFQHVSGPHAGSIGSGCRPPFQENKTLLLLNIVQNLVNKTQFIHEYIEH